MPYPRSALRSPYSRYGAGAYYGDRSRQRFLDERERLIAMQQARFADVEPKLNELSFDDAQPMVSDRFRVQGAPQPFTTDIYRAGKLSQRNTGFAPSAPYETQPGGWGFAPFDELEKQMDAQVAELSKQAVRFDPEAQARWRRFTADQAIIERWAEDKGAKPEEVFDVKRQMFDRHVANYDWQRHIAPPGSLIGDVVPDGLWMKQKKKDGWDVIGPNLQLPDEEWDKLMGKMSRPIIQDGVVVGYASLDPNRMKVNIERAGELDPKKYIEILGDYQEQFKEQYGYAPTPLDMRDGLRRQLSAMGVPLPESIGRLSPQEVVSSIAQFGRFLQKALREETAKTGRTDAILVANRWKIIEAGAWEDPITMAMWNHYSGVKDETPEMSAAIEAYVEQQRQQQLQQQGPPAMVPAPAAAGFNAAPPMPGQPTAMPPTLGQPQAPAWAEMMGLHPAVLGDQMPTTQQAPSQPATPQGKPQEVVVAERMLEQLRSEYGNNVPASKASQVAAAIQLISAYRAKSGER